MQNINKVYIIFGIASDWEDSLKINLGAFKNKEAAQKALNELNEFCLFNKEFEVKINSFKKNIQDIYAEPSPMVKDHLTYSEDYLIWNDLIETELRKFINEHFNLPLNLIKFKPLMEIFHASFDKLNQLFDWSNISFSINELNLLNDESEFDGRGGCWLLKENNKQNA